MIGCLCVELKIHYKEKKILLLWEGERILFEGIKFKLLLQVIYAMQAMSSVRKGCNAYLVSITIVSRRNLAPVEVRVIRDCGRFS